MSDPQPRIAILGAGPTGLEAALAAADRGLPFTLYEAAPGVGGSVRGWGHVRLFTPWEMNVSPRMRRHLATAGGAPPDGGDCPTGADLVARLFEPIAVLPAVAPHLRLSTRVVAVGREGLLKHEEIATEERARRPFRLLVRGRDGGESIEHADVVIDATGTWGRPNRLGDGGIPAPGEAALDAEIARHLPDFARQTGDWAGKTVLLAGAGHSAQTAVRDLAELARQAPGTRVMWALRSPWRDDSPGAPDPLPERGRLAAAAAELAHGGSPAIEAWQGAAVEQISRPNGRFEVTLRTANGPRQAVVDRILALTGYVGDFELYRQLQVHECYATSGPMKLSAALFGAAGAGAGDCLAQTSHGADTLTNPEPGFFLLGSKSYGRNNTFLMRVGWEQVGEVFGLLA
jgi:cation diffusion facilitator CzcD-associated flavoprotein CzcO